ncbi:MAG TPA: LPS export ABC transporter permease LptG [Woeseiaceae bacterium]|nr:LPS export ABC transporter permease LptG [Woeseiaceae bacterium]
MNGILTGYLMRAILTSSGLVLGVLLALAGLFEFIAELDDVRNDYSTPQAVLFALFRLPNLAFEMMPVAVLIGSLLGLGALAAHSEIIVMRASGLSVRRLAAMVSVTGLVLLVFAALLGEFVGPPLDFYARDMRQSARYGQEDDRVGSSTWVRDGPVYLHLERVSPEFEFGSLYIYRFKNDHTLESIARAENSGIGPDDQWRLENLRETRFENDGVQVVSSNLALGDFEVNAELLANTLAKPLSLSMRGLLTYIDYLDRNALDSRQYRTELWYRVSRTVTVLVMPILALAFVFGSLRSGGTGSRLLIGVVIGLAYYLASEMLANSGQVFNLNPLAISWLPTSALILVTVIALARIR